MNDPTDPITLPTNAELAELDPPQPSSEVESALVNGDEAPAPETGLPNIGPVDISQLEMIGFGQARQDIIGLAINAQNIDPGVFAATLDMASRMLAREKLVGTAEDTLDMIETDIAVMRAVDKFRKALKDIGERQQARAALRGPAQPPADVLAAANGVTPA